MAARTAVTPNRRGVKSRELVLDAAERVMAKDGFEAATLARVVEESGIPMSSVYHYYGSKDGILLAVMERGNERFLADLPDPDERLGTPVEHLRLVVATAVATLERHPSFLRLLIVFGDNPRSAKTDRLARFALAAVDGAFVASQTDTGVTLQRLLAPMPEALAAAREALSASRAGPS